MAQYDPFSEDNIDNEPSRGPGRPRTREVRERGNVGRPRIRPIDDPSSRRRGRPQIDANSVADKIQREAIISGNIVAKSISGSVQGLSGAVRALEKGVVEPLSRTVSAFSQSLNKFNNYHQQYLKDQVAISRQIHESFKLFRKSAIDPVMIAAARMEKGTRYLHETMSQVYEGGYQGVAFKKMRDNVSKINDQIGRFVKYGTLGLETTDTFLKEYYKTSKGTSKFLNSVSYAAEDISEDLIALKNDLQKYFRGKGSKTVLQDQTEALRRIEKNTQGPGLAKRIMSAATTSVIAGLKTAFKYNRFGTTEFISELTGFRMPNMEEQKDMSGRPTKLAKFAKLIGETIDIQTRQVARDASGKIRNVLDTTAGGAHGEFLAGGAEYAKDVIASLNSLKNKAKNQWDESGFKRRAKWLWEIGKSMFLDQYDYQGAQGVRAIRTVISNYEKGNEPHEGRQTGDIRRAQSAYDDLTPAGKKAFMERIRAEALESNKERILEKGLGLKVVNLDSKRKGGPSYSFGGFEGTGALQGEDLPENPFEYLSRMSKSKTNAKVYYPDFSKGAKRTRAKIDQMGPGPVQVNANPESNTKITSGDTSSMRKAFGSLIKLQIRIHGLLQKMFKHVKKVDQNTDELEEGLFDKAKDGLFGGNGILGGLAAGLAGTKLSKGLGALKGGWKGAALAGGAAAGAGALRLAKTGSAARVLWDTFGWGNAAKGGMGALANFKKTSLGKSFLGRIIRQARLASANVGTSAGARIGRFIIHANKWGGVLDPIGASAGFFNAAKTGRNLKGALGASKASVPFLNKIGMGMDKVGAGILNWGKGINSKIVNAGAKLGGLTNISKAGNLAKAGGLLGGLGTAAKAFFKKVPILGGLFTIGLGLKELVKDRDWKSGLWHIFTGTLMAIPATAIAGTILSVGGDVAKFASNKLKERNANKVPNAEAAGAAAVQGVSSESDIVNGVTNVAGINPYGKNGPAKSSIGISNTEDHYKGAVVANPKATPKGMQKKPANASKSSTSYGVVGTTAKAVKNVASAAKAKATSLSQKILASSKQVVNGNTKPKHLCLRHVRIALQNAGLEGLPRKESAYMYADVLAKRPDMKEVNYSPGSLASTPAGAIVVWGKGTTSDGHISISDGHGKEYSDYVGNQRIKTSRRDGKTYGAPRVFIPQDKSGYGGGDRVIGTASPAVSSLDISRSLPNSRNAGYGADAPASAPTTTPTMSSNSTPTTSPEANTEISPIIQDYGLAIINNLLFS